MGNKWSAYRSSTYRSLDKFQFSRSVVATVFAYDGDGEATTVRRITGVVGDGGNLFEWPRGPESSDEPLANVRDCTYHSPIFFVLAVRTASVKHLAAARNMTENHPPALELIDRMIAAAKARDKKLYASARRDLARLYGLAVRD